MIIGSIGSDNATAPIELLLSVCHHGSILECPTLDQTTPETKPFLNRAR